MKTILTAAMLAGFLGATVLSAQPALAGQSSATTPAPAAPAAADARRGDAYYYFTMGHLRQQQSQSDVTGSAALAQQSIEYYKKALELAPGSAVVLEALAESYARTQHVRDAVTQAQAALKIDPTNLEAHRLLARIYVSTLGDMNAGAIQQENLTKAVEQFEALLKLDPMDTYSALWLARLYGFENRHTEAEGVLRGIVQRNPDSGPALEQLSQLLIDQGRAAEAIELLKRAAGDDSSPDVYDLLGNAYSQSKDLARAEQAYRKAVEIDPDDPDHRRGLAQALLGQQKYAGALEQYRKLAQADPGNAENYVRMAQINRRLGQFDEAGANLQQAKHLAPGSVEIIFNEALLYQDQGRYGDAVRILSDAIAGLKSRGAGNPGALAILFEQLGSTYRAQQNYSAAIESFEQLETLGPDARKRGVLLRIGTYRDSRDFDRAIAEARKELETSPNDPDVTVALAMLYGEKSDTATATRLLQGLLKGNESDQEIYINLAQVQQRGREYAEAERSAEKAEQLAQESSGKESAWFMLGSIYERQKKFDQAEQQFRKVLAANPNSAPVLNYYGYMLADRGIRLDEASSMIRRAVQQEPANGAYLDSLGWVCFKQNKLAEAEESLRKAVSRESHDPTILGHLGDVYLKLGQSERAAELLERSLAEWQKALPADYDAERAGETEAKLKTLRRRLAQKSIPETVKPQ